MELVSGLGVKTGEVVKLEVVEGTCGADCLVFHLVI